MTLLILSLLTSVKWCTSSPMLIDPRQHQMMKSWPGSSRCSQLSVMIKSATLIIVKFPQVVNNTSLWWIFTTGYSIVLVLMNQRHLAELLLSSFILHPKIYLTSKDKLKYMLSNIIYNHFYFNNQVNLRSVFLQLGPEKSYPCFLTPWVSG